VLARAADSAPEVGFPGDVEGDEEVPVVGGGGDGEKRPVVGDLVAYGGAADGYGGEELGAVLADDVVGLVIDLEGGGDGLVGGGAALFEVVELGVLIDGPPVAAVGAVGGGG